MPHLVFQEKTILQLIADQLNSTAILDMRRIKHVAVDLSEETEFMEQLREYLKDAPQPTSCMAKERWVDETWIVRLSSSGCSLRNLQRFVIPIKRADGESFVL